MTAVALHAGYIFATIVLITALLLLGAVLRVVWCQNVFRAWDHLGAALFGGDGEHSISAYTGARAYAGAAYVEVLIDGIFGEGHCRAAARKEGLLA